MVQCYDSRFPIQLSGFNTEDLSAFFFQFVLCFFFSSENSISDLDQQSNCVKYLTIGSCISVRYRVMMHAGSLESTR